LLANSFPTKRLLTAAVGWITLLHIALVVA
jgi:hypothetical protein